MKITTPFTFLIGLAGLLQAHDLYVMPSTFAPARGAIITVGFHVGDSFPESEVSGRVDRLRDPKLMWAGGSGAIGNLRVDGKRDVGDVEAGGDGESIAAVSTLPTLIKLPAAKFTEYLREEGLTETIGWREQHGESSKPGKERYSKYAKAILLSGKANGFGNHAAGFVIEIIPEKDVYRLKAGASLPIQVLFRGKPAAGVQTESAWASNGRSKSTVVGRTGADGRLEVPLPTAGLWRIHTIKMERCAEPTVADWESFWASTTFEVK